MCQFEAHLRFCFAILVKFFTSYIYSLQLLNITARFCISLWPARACFFHGTQCVHNGRLSQSRSGAHDGIRGILCWCWTVRKEKYQRNSKIFILVKTWDCTSSGLIPAKLACSRKLAVHLQQMQVDGVGPPASTSSGTKTNFTFSRLCNDTDRKHCLWKHICIALLTTGPIGSNKIWWASSTWDRWSCTLA